MSFYEMVFTWWQNACSRFYGSTPLAVLAAIMGCSFAGGAVYTQQPGPEATAAADELEPPILPSVT